MNEQTRDIQATTGEPMSINKAFATASAKVSHPAGLPSTFGGCCLVIVIWAATGPVLGFSDTWQLIINTGTTIITFLSIASSVRAVSIGSR